MGIGFSGSQSRAPRFAPAKLLGSQLLSLPRLLIDSLDAAQYGTLVLMHKLGFVVVDLSFSKQQSLSRIIYLVNTKGVAFLHSGMYKIYSCDDSPV